MNTNICIVEDNTPYLNFVSKAVELSGFKPSCFNNPINALKDIQKKYHLYDLYILDIMMPGMNGIVLAQNIKEIEPEAQIVFLSAKRDPNDLKILRKIQCDHYLNKGLPLDKLMEKIQNLINRYPQNSIGHITVLEPTEVNPIKNVKLEDDILRFSHNEFIENESIVEFNLTPKKKIPKKIVAKVFDSLQLGKNFFFTAKVLEHYGS